MNKTVTIFGSSLPVYGEEQYENAYKLGCILARNGFNVCTGGNMGIMEAVSRGAVENGAAATGITLKDKFDFHNAYLSKRITCENLFERITKLLNTGDGYIILQGGTGTLLELAAVWELINKGFIAEKPVACHGKMWKPIIENIENQIALEKRKTGLVRYFDEIEDCADYISNCLK